MRVLFLKFVVWLTGLLAIALWVFIVVGLVLIGAHYANAQTFAVVPAFNLAGLGLDGVHPYTVELDGDTATTEWVVQKGFPPEYWYVDPGLGCKRRLDYTIPVVSGNTATLWWIGWTRVGGVDTILVYDTNVSDGVAPVWYSPVTKGC